MASRSVRTGSSEDPLSRKSLSGESSDANLLPGIADFMSMNDSGHKNDETGELMDQLVKKHLEQVTAPASDKSRQPAAAADAKKKDQQSGNPAGDASLNDAIAQLLGNASQKQWAAGDGEEPATVNVADADQKGDEKSTPAPVSRLAEAEAEILSDADLPEENSHSVQDAQVALSAEELDALLAGANHDDESTVPAATIQDLANAGQHDELSHQLQHADQTVQDELNQLLGDTPSPQEENKAAAEPAAQAQAAPAAPAPQVASATDVDAMAEAILTGAKEIPAEPAVDIEPAAAQQPAESPPAPEAPASVEDMTQAVADLIAGAAAPASESAAEPEASAPQQESAADVTGAAQAADNAVAQAPAGAQAEAPAEKTAAENNAGQASAEEDITTSVQAEIDALLTKESAPEQAPPEPQIDGDVTVPEPKAQAQAAATEQAEPKESSVAPEAVVAAEAENAKSESPDQELGAILQNLTDPKKEEPATEPASAATEITGAPEPVQEKPAVEEKKSGDPHASAKAAAAALNAMKTVVSAAKEGRTMTEEDVKKATVVPKKAKKPGRPIVTELLLTIAQIFDMPFSWVSDSTKQIVGISGALLLLGGAALMVMAFLRSTGHH